MAKQLNVNLAFNAETAQAKRAIEDLSNSLRKIQLQPSRMFDDVDLKKASQAAQDLEKHLRAAVNVDTGKLDLNKFSQSLASSKQNLGDLYKDLSRAGADGQAAFLNLAKSINAADSSTLNLGSKLRELTTTLKNTARWEISSKIMHGFESAISSAYNYAQDLNKSLNDIRIVTGQSSEQMAEFADRANKAAKALSTSTTNYTDASLIYYQQGLSDAEVEERTAVTIKMANAAGVSAKTVSDQLTAVWNNFDDGSKSLEYYADVMTALGAATASSTDEISQGLNKFAAVAETVGLSYEYATAALATVTAETRESADVVGTAYKTLFARIQGLQQGDTMEDGTTLNKYSAALAKVGIDIKTVSGDMKDMDTILEEMGAKWGTLAKDQQLALAQTVAGVRQYNQLIALMDNWDVFQNNLDIAYNSEGTLQKQADIYAESWEAASKRVQAAAQGIYQELLNDDFFIDILNGFEGFLTGINNIIDGVGGLKTILLSVGGILLKQYSKEIPSALATIGDNFDVLTGKADKAKQNILNDLVNALNQEDVSLVSNETNAEIQAVTKISEYNENLNKVKKNLSESELRYYENKKKQLELYGETAAAIGKEKDEIEKLINVQKQSMAENAVKAKNAEIKKYEEEIKKQEELIEIKKKAAVNRQIANDTISEQITQADEKANEAKQNGNESEYIMYIQQKLQLQQQQVQQAKELADAQDEVTEAEQKLNEIRKKQTKALDSKKSVKEIKDQIEALDTLNKKYANIHAAGEKVAAQKNMWKDQAKSIEGNAEETEKLQQSMQAYVEYLKSLGASGKVIEDIEEQLKNTKTSAKELVEIFDKFSIDDIEIDNKSFEEYQKQIDKISEELAKSGVSKKELSDLAEQYKIGAITAEDYRISLERLIRESSEVPKATIEISEAFGLMASTAMEVFASIEAIKNLGSIWSDQDTTYGEKLIATFSALATLIPTVISLQETYNALKTFNLKTEIAELAIKKGIIAGEAAENVQQAIQNGQLSVELVLRSLLNTQMLKQLAIYAALAAIIGIVIGVGKLLYDWYNKDAEASREAADQAKVLTERYEDLKNKAEELNDAVADYEDARDALSKLEKGTDEYADALENANEKARELIETYGLWDNYHMEGGQIVIDEEAYKNKQAEYKQQAEQAQAQMYQGEIYSNQAQIRNQTTNLKRKVGTFEYQDDNGYNYRKLSDNETQYIGQVVNELKESLGGVIPTTEQVKQKLTELAEQGDTNLNTELLSGLNDIITSETIPGFISLGKSLDEASAANKYYSKQILGIEVEKQHSDDVKKMVTDDDNNIDDTKYNQIMDVITEKAFQAEEEKGNTIDKKYAAVESDVKDIDTAKELKKFLVKEENKEAAKKVLGEDYDFTRMNDKDLALRYAAMMSGEDISTLTYTKGNGKGTVKDKEGNSIIDEVSDEVMRREIAKQVAMQSITDEYAKSIDGSTEDMDAFKNAMSTMLEGATAAAEEYGVDFSTAILDSMANGDYESLDFSGLFSELDPEEIKKLSGLDSEGIMGLLNIDEDVLKSLGYDVDKFTNAFSKALDKWKYTVDTTKVEEKSATLKDITDDIELGDIISKESYDKLIEAGVNAEDYFTKMEDGTYKLTNAAEEFKAVVEGITIQEYIDKIKEFNATEDKARDDIQEKYKENSFIDKNLLNSDVVGNNQMGEARAQYINTFEGDFGFSEEQKKLLTKDSSEYTPEDLQELANMMDMVAGKSVEMQGQLLSTADSLDELNALARRMQEEGIGINSQAWGEALIGLASQYDNCANEIKDFQEALESGDQAMIEAAEDALKLGIAVGELSKKYGLDAEDVETHAKLIQQNTKNMQLSGEQAARLAVANQRMNRGVATLNDNWKDWSKVLKKADKTTADYAKTLNDAHEALADLVGAVDAGSIPIDFLDATTESGAEHLEWMARAAEGDAQAINLLGSALAITQVKGMQFSQSMAQAYADAFKFDVAEVESRFAAAQTIVTDAMQQIHNAINSGLSNEEIQAKIDGMGSGWINALNEMAMATGMSVDEMNSLLNQLGVQAKVDVADVTQKMKVPTYTEVSEPLQPVTVYNTTTTEDGNVITMPSTRYGWRKYTVPGPSIEVDGTVQVAQISTEDGGIEPPKVNYTGTSGGSVGGGVSPSSTSSGGGGGGGGSSEKEPSKPNKTKVTKQSEIVERFKELNDTLDDLTHAYEKASRAADRLYGANRLKALKEQNELLKQQQQVLAQKLALNEAYLEQDRKALQQAASAAGLTFSFDSNGNLSNYTSQMQALYDQLAAAENHYNSLATGEEQDSYTETILDPLRDKISELESAMSLYEETKELFEDIELEMEDIQDQIYQNNYDIIMEGLELRIKVNEDDLKLIDYYLSKIEDDFYSMAEAAALIAGPDGTNQLNSYLNNLKEYEAAIEELNNAYVQGEITEAMWNEGIQEVKDSILDNLSSLNDLDKQMKEYYGETLDMAQEELEKFTNELEQQTEILEHYQTMMEILGKQMDYDSMGVILKGQVETIENEMEVAEAAYELYKQQADQKKQLLEDAIARGDTAAAEIYQKEWEAAQEAALDAQDEMLDKTEQWAEAMRAVVENELAGLARSLEEALTGGTSFDYVNTQLERAASLQEEYLTTTNQIYETNKLMRTAQQEIDKSTNLVAKQRLKDFIKETNQLQNKSKLSKYELEIQQAKYNLLLAEIALEDAQNAKTSVRLQRDSEGNFGYVYVADQSQLAKAQQDLEDAQNTLYNIGLDGVNEYTEKYAQTMQEMYDTLTSITEAYYNGEITSQEDYEAQMLAAQQYYYEKLENYQDLYGIALETDTRAIQDSWAFGFKSMIYNTNTWKEKVADYTKAATLSLSNWYNKVEEISNKTGLDNIANSVKNVTNKSEELRDKILEDGGVVDALYQELESVSALTRQYAEYRSALQQTIIEYERLITQAIKLTQANREAIATSNAAMEAAKRVQEQNFSNSVLGNTSSSGNSNSTNKDTNTPKDPGTTTTTTETNGTKKYKISYTVDGTTYYLTGIYTTDADAESRARAAIIAKATTLATTTGADNVKTIDYQQKTKLINSASIGKITTWDTDIALLDSGGYTGDWGPQGKLAVLHEKEIVLNKNDTANFLASMEILERILNVIDLQTMNSQLGGLITPSIGGGFGSSASLDQNVHIEASFPGVQDRYEIEEAFNTLINKASQYANRK